MRSEYFKISKYHTLKRFPGIRLFLYTCVSRKRHLFMNKIRGRYGISVEKYIEYSLVAMINEKMLSVILIVNVAKVTNFKNVLTVIYVLTDGIADQVRRISHSTTKSEMRLTL